MIEQSNQTSRCFANQLLQYGGYSIGRGVAFYFRKVNQVGQTRVGDKSFSAKKQNIDYQ